MAPQSKSLSYTSAVSRLNLHKVSAIYMPLRLMTGYPWNIPVGEIFCFHTDGTTIAAGAISYFQFRKFLKYRQYKHVTCTECLFPAGHETGLRCKFTSFTGPLSSSSCEGIFVCMRTCIQSAIMHYAVTDSLNSCTCRDDNSVHQRWYAEGTFGSAC